MNSQHDVAVGTLAQELQHLEVLRCVHGTQRLSRQVTHVIQELDGCLEGSKALLNLLWRVANLQPAAHAILGVSAMTRLRLLAHKGADVVSEHHESPPSSNGRLAVFGPDL